MSAPAFKPGDAVFLASAGLGRVLEYAARTPGGKPGPLPAGGTPEFYVVEAGETVACVPFSRAETLRPPVSPELAAQMLDALRAAAPPPSPPEPLLERGKRIVHSGTPLEHAAFLRELYALPVPVADAIASGIAFLERLVLPELAAVLGLERQALEQELRQRYPAARDAKDRAALVRFL